MSPTNKRACGLVRVSSEEQAKAGYGLEYQETDIRTFCVRNSLELVDVFRDEGYSGSTAARPGFQRMMEWARDKRFDVLVVWKLDRLFRDTKLTLQTVDELASLGIEFRSVQESFTHDSNGRFLLTIFAAGAEKERKDIAMRMHAGRIASAKRGTWIAGASTPPFGYRYNPTTKRLEIDDDEARVVRQIFQWFVVEKLSLYKIQMRLNDLKVPTKFDRIGRKKPSGSKSWWRKRTIGRIVGYEVYTGKFTFRKYAHLGRVRNAANLRPQEEWLVADCPAIISADTFRKAQEQIQKNSENSPRRTKALYLLSKLLICAHDNRRMQASRRPPAGGNRECKYYFCSGIRKEHSEVRCPSATVSESRIVPPIWDKIRELLADPATVLAGLTQYRDRQFQSDIQSRQKSVLEAGRVKSGARLSRLIELYLSQAVDKEYFRTEQRRLKAELEGFERELKKLRDSELTQDELRSRARSITDIYAAYKNKLDNASDELKREIFQTFIKSVVVRGEDLDIEVMLPPTKATPAAKSNFAGQPPHPLSRKTPVPRKNGDFAEQQPHPLSRKTPVPRKNGDFAEQQPHLLSLKENLTLFLHTKLLSVSHIFREKRIHENFGERTGGPRGKDGLRSAQRYRRHG